MSHERHDDRLPPENLDAERSVLGSMLRDNVVIDDVSLIVAAEDFYTDAHQKLFAAIVALHQAGQPVDLVTTAEEMQRRKYIEDIGSYAYLASLWDAAPTAANAVHYAKVVREKSTFRRLARAADRIAQAAWSPTGPAAEAIALAEREVFALAEDAVAGDVADAAQVVGEVYDHVDACHSDQDESRGIPWGFMDLDTKTGGLQPSALVLVAARPSVGKTALGAAVALRLALASRPVFFASLEQTRCELMVRMMCSKAKVNSHVLRKGLLDAGAIERLREAGDKILRAPLQIDHCGGQTVLRIAANARRMKRRQGLAAVFIDYLQLIEPSDRRAQRYEQIGEISRRLKAMAKELAVPVVAMCQLNRASEDRTGKRPRLSDLRESGSLEMDADVVVLMHRSDGNDNVIELNVAKNRNGPTGDVKLTYLPEFTRFENFAADRPQWRTVANDQASFKENQDRL
jgi:replicative DNA helicase